VTSDYVDMPFSGVSINRNWATRNKVTIGKFLAAYTKAIQWLSDPANRAEAVSILMSVSSIKSDDVEKTYDFLIKPQIFEPTGKIPRSKLVKVVDALKQLGDIPANFEVDRLFLAGVTQVGD
jgi:ABC-type nitrate/sulfonate/bicarbonate transport system substrate-binding protein